MFSVLTKYERPNKHLVLVTVMFTLSLSTDPHSTPDYYGLISSSGSLCSYWIDCIDVILYLCGSFLVVVLFLPFEQRAAVNKAKRFPAAFDKVFGILTRKVKWKNGGPSFSPSLIYLGLLPVFFFPPSNVAEGVPHKCKYSYSLLLQSWTVPLVFRNRLSSLPKPETRGPRIQL